MQKVQLSVEDGMSVASDQAYWDGFAAGVAAAADHAKRLGVQRIIKSQPPAPIVQSEPAS